MQLRLKPLPCNVKIHILFFLTTLLYSTQALSAPLLIGKVIHVSDGDTIKILVDHTQIKVRLAEIDAPELHQAYGRKSKQYLGNLVFGKVVTVEQVDIDRYGRTVGKVYLGKRYVNADMVKSGYAWFYRKYGKDLTLYDLENEARAGLRGLWADANPIPPWEWRKNNRK
jgi:endonuclease YncB( thermonuclease family)